MRANLTILLILCLHLLTGQQLYVSSDAILYVSQGANLEVGGDLENDGTLLNTGTLSLYGDWSVNNIFNGNEGRLAFVGGQDQNVNLSSLITNTLIMNQSGEVVLSSPDFTVTDTLRLVSGVLNTNVDSTTRFVLESDARVIGGSTFSYLEGKMSYQGAGIRRFPVGFGGLYAPISFLNVFGTDPELTVYFQTPNPEVPVPGDDLLGVSDNGLWEVESTGGDLVSTPIQIDFQGEDLENFGIRNNIRHRINSPTIAIASSPGGVYRSLGVLELLDTDSTSFGSITSEIDYLPVDTVEKAYFAIALAPRIDPNGLVYIPNVFSPAASDPDNQSFKIFGERISGDGFSLQIFNRFGSLVYSTDSWNEANQFGWSGVNQRTGSEEPSGLYFYQVRLIRENGLREEFQGPFYLQR